MVRPTPVISLAIWAWLASTACESVLGTVDVAPAPPIREQASGQLESESPGAPPGPVDYPPFTEPIVGLPSVPPLQVDAGASERVDAGVAVTTQEAGADAAPPDVEPDLTPRPVIVEGPVATLERVGFDGGGPRRGACDPGIVIGVRPTANPNEDGFGQRLTFVEPICGAAQVDVEGGAIRVMRDDSLLRWDTSGDFEGEPSFAVPDERLLWVQQPEAFCPETAPALVGLSGEYDPVGVEAADTAVIRSLVIECAPLVVAESGVDVAADAGGHQLISRADSFSASGEEGYRSACDGGTVITELQLHAGFWLDGFVLGCAGLRSPQRAGAPCSADRECQSLCEPAGLCAP